MACEACPLRGRLRVISRGPADAGVVVVGQSPGREELARGLPFVGPSGQLLTQALAEAGFSPAHILFTNAVQCSDGNTPQKAAIDCCRSNLFDILSRHTRQLIIALGNEAWYTLVGGQIGGALKGQGRTEQSPELGCPVFWNLHPAYVLRSLGAYSTWVAQFRRAYALLHGGLRDICPEVEVVGPGHYGADYLTDDHWAMGTEALAIDVETTGLVYWQHHVLGIGLSDGNRALYICWAHGDNRLPEDWVISPWTEAERQHIRSWLSRVVGGTKKIVGHNVSQFDSKFLLYHLGVDIRPVWTDTMLAHHLIDENAPHSLKSISQTWLMATSWEQEAQEAIRQQRLHSMPLSDLARYCATDCVCNMALVGPIRQRMAEEEVDGLYDRLVGPLSDVLVDMELHGVMVDQGALNEADAAVSAKIADLISQVRELSHFGPGTHCPWRNDEQDGINPNSSRDIVQVLYGPHGFNVEPQRFTPGGEPSTDEEALLSISSHSSAVARFVDALLRYRRLAKVYTTYIAAIRRYIAPDGAVHADFLFNSQTEDSPKTGRLSSSHPNMQNIPKQIRPIFIARPGYVFWEADQSSLEVRVWAHMSGDPALLRIFERSVSDGLDYHTMIASICFGVPYEEVTKEQRSVSKVITFGGIMYGGEEFVLARELKTTPDAIRGLMDRLYHAFPKGQRWLSDQVRLAHQRGYVRSTIGRRRRLPDIKSSDDKVRQAAERQAKNAPIQGLASDINNMALLRLMAFVRKHGLDIHPVNIVHDSILLEVPADKAEELSPVLKGIAEEEPFPGFGVPLQVECAVTKRWGGDFDVEAICNIGGGSDAT